MLLESVTSLVEKRIGIITHSEGLAALLRGLLTQWNYALLDAPAADDLLLVEEGCLAPVGHLNVLWLTSSRYEGRNRLCLPLPMEELWRNVESRYHKPPRNHIRIAVQIPVAVHARGEIIPAQVASLSDLGMRFDFPRELVSGEELRLELVLDGDALSMAGRVIYVVPRGDLEGTGRSEVGVIFARTPSETHTRVREHILWRYLAAVRRETPEGLFREGLKFFRIPENVLQRLGCLEAGDTRDE